MRCVALPLMLRAVAGLVRGPRRGPIGLSRSATGAAAPGAAGAAAPGMTAVASLRELVDDYDVFLLDQYGVLHNGERLLPGVAEALESLHRAGKKLVVLSNTSRRRSVLLAELPSRGFDADWLAGAVCSGEECHRELGTAWRGKRAVFLGWERDADDAGYLEGTGVRLADVADADCLVAHGPDTILGTAAAVKTGFRESGEIGPYLEVLKKAAVRRLPMLVANPDQVTLQGAARQVLYMPGSIADAYRALGGDVIDFGKPSKALFDAAVDAAEWPTAPRVIHVGDSLKHDVHGARGANIDSLFVIETGELVDADGALRDDTTIAAVAASYGAPLPTHYCAMFKW